MTDERTAGAGTHVPAVRFEGITKRFGGTLALDGVGFDVEAGKVHALLGGNGSGKSTLIKILTGVYQADHGEIAVHGQQQAASRTTPDWARSVDIHVVHQGIGVFPDLTVADNFALSSGYGTRALAPISRRRLRREVSEILARFDLDVSPSTRMGDLQSAVQTMIAVARALAHEEDDAILILDEPTAALPQTEEHMLLDAVRDYRRRGHTVIMVTHRLDEVTAVADNVTFLRDGRHLYTGPAKQVGEGEMVRQIAGMEQLAQREAVDLADRPIRLEVRGVTVAPLEDVSFSARQGEVLGISGLLGSGRSTIMLTLFGLHRPESGTLVLDGEQLEVANPAEAVDQGIAYVSPDRQREGIFLERSVRDNLSITDLRRYWRSLRISRGGELRDARKVISGYGVVVASPEAPVSSMSGGNQQKVAIARWLELQPRLLLLNEPTQGVDVGARAAIHALVREAARAGTTVLVSSSDSRELAELCDRVIGLYKGRLTGEVSGDELTASRCLELAYGGTALEEIAQEGTANGHP